MWIFLNDAFISVVAHKDNKDLLMVRARKAGDISRALGYEVEEQYTPEADYPYRRVVSKVDFYADFSWRIYDLEATNFKNSISQDNGFYHDACLRVWGIMRSFQDLVTGG